MALNYDEICDENRLRYGTEGAQKSGALAAGLYDNRTHFIFELLQNAEDALERRGKWDGPRKAEFKLSSKRLSLSHFGKPFDEADVRSVCDIAESTKNEGSIGRFGLGFKSVYAVTNLPEIHSGTENFAIEGYVFPKLITPTERTADETQIVLPLIPEDIAAPKEIVAGLQNLGPRTLLFLRQIEEIQWSVEGGESGFYLRNRPEPLGGNVQRVTVIGQESGQPEIDQSWLVFHREVLPPEGEKSVKVEVAFSLASSDPQCRTVESLASSPLVVFFPTIVESHLGFLVQGPYRTTPSRDNIPPKDPWNQELVQQTAKLLVEAMKWMRDKAMLDVAALNCLPLDPDKFPEGSRFEPLFDAVCEAFQVEALLPTYDGSYVPAHRAKLARTQELRDLLSPHQISELFEEEATTWLSGEFTQDKTPEILQYLTGELGIDQVTPIKLIANLTKDFLEAQSDEWVLRLYKFLSGQEAALRRHLNKVPLIRLEDGTHVVASQNGEIKAFLPSDIATSFPTMRPSVCATPEVRTFLESLGVTEPDPVDDVIWNILPKYQKEKIVVVEEAYASDIDRMVLAFGTDSTKQKEKLRSALSDTTFVMVVDAGDGKGYIEVPNRVYIASDKLKQLFNGVEDVLIVDPGYSCLRGENIRELLVACGASRYLAPEEIQPELNSHEKKKIRKEAGLESLGRLYHLYDYAIRGLNGLLKLLSTMEHEEAKDRAGILWDALADMEGRGTAAFEGSYKWSYSHEVRTAKFDASFIRELNQASWVPNLDGELVPPSHVVFDNLGWKPNAFLQAKIKFKPPVIEQLAQEVGIDPAALDLLRKHGITNVEELAERLGIDASLTEPEPSEETEPTPDTSDTDVYDDANDLYGDDMPEIPPGAHDPDGGDSERIGGGGSKSGSTDTPRTGGGGNTSGGKGGGRRCGARSPGSKGGRPFISYVGAHPEDSERDPDSLDQAVRMKIEEQAITAILAIEPELHRTPEGNPGFDLFEIDGTGTEIRWIEVKAMTGCLEDRPVGLSNTQFDYARDKKEAYWLYVVEYATDPKRTRVLRIQDPYAQTRTFTFDQGWSGVALTEPPES